MTNQGPSPARRNAKLYKDPANKKIGGVAAGVANYFEIDVTLVRVVWALAILVGGFGLLLYLVLWAILEDDPGAYADPARPVEATAVHGGDDGSLEDAHEEIEAETFASDLGDTPTES